MAGPLEAGLWRWGPFGKGTRRGGVEGRVKGWFRGGWRLEVSASGGGSPRKRRRGGSLLCRLLQVTILRPRGQASPRRSQCSRERLGQRQLRHCHGVAAHRCLARRRCRRGPVTSRGPGIEQRLLLLRFGRPGGGCTLHDRQPIGSQVAGGAPTHGTGRANRRRLRSPRACDTVAGLV